MDGRPFRNRADAGQELARRLLAYERQPGVVVLGLARGGVPVAAEVAARLGVPLDVLVVRKLGVEGRAELAMGAIASGGVRVLNNAVVDGLGIGEGEIERVAQREGQELERRTRLYRGDRPEPDLAGKVVIVVDDGLATGSTMRAAVAAIRRRAPARIVVAVPVGAPATCQELASEADDVVCLRMPHRFFAVGQWYRDFSATTDDEVAQAVRGAPGGA